jgi:hypothetical protein
MPGAKVSRTAFGSCLHKGADSPYSFAIMELNLILSKLCWKYDMELVDQSLDWEGQSKVHVMWDKPALTVRFHLAKGISTLKA